MRASGRWWGRTEEAGAETHRRDEGRQEDRQRDFLSADGGWGVALEEEEGWAT